MLCLCPLSPKPFMHNTPINWDGLPAMRSVLVRSLTISHMAGIAATTTPNAQSPQSCLPSSPWPTIIGANWVSFSHLAKPLEPLTLCCRPFRPQAERRASRSVGARKKRKAKAARAFSSAPTLASIFLQLSSPQNLAIKTPSPRPQLHRKRNPFGLGPARHVHLRWMSNIRRKLPCALGEPSPIVTTKTPTATRTAAVEKMVKGPARDSGGLCLYRKHNDFFHNYCASFWLSFTNRRPSRDWRCCE
jgi:hypothetical protein